MNDHTLQKQTISLTRGPMPDRCADAHVVHVTTVHGPFDTRIFHKECRALADAGYHVSLIASHDKSEVRSGVEMVPLPRYANRLLRILLGPWQVYQTAYRQRAKLYHIHDPELLLVALLLKWTAEARIVYDVHEHHAKKMLAREWIAKPFRWIASAGVFLIERSTVPFFDALVCVTEHIAAIFPNAGTYVVKNYPPLEVTAPKSQGSGQSVYQRTEPENGKDVQQSDWKIIYTGGWTDHRGIYQIVQALEFVQTPNLTLTLLGKCIDPHVQEQAKRLPGWDRVDYLGLVSYEEVRVHMSAASIGLVCNQPSHDYDKAQPNKLFEYMAAGLPVIASHFPLWKEIVEGRQCGVTVDPTDPVKIAEAIDYLIANPEILRNMGENGRIAAATTYNWRIEKEKLLDLYKELLD